MKKKMPSCPTWDELASTARAGRFAIRDYLDRWPEGCDAVALALSVAHWHPEERERMLTMAMRGEYIGGVRVRYYGENCGLCARHSGCHGCPIKPRCDKDGSLWQEAIIANVQGPAADAMYNKLLRLYVKAWEKLPEVEE